MTAKEAGARDGPRFVLFAYGFRPFFLLTGIWAIVPMVVVLSVLLFGGWPADATALFVWHGHEMIFGFVIAAVAGFLLTAVPSWTGIKALSGGWLVALVALWIASRVLSAPAVQPAGIPSQILALAFLPVLATLVAIPLVRTRNFRNLPLLGVLFALFVAEGVYQAARCGWIAELPFDPLRLSLNTVLLLVVVIGGRIVPAFTRNAFLQMDRAGSVTSHKWLDVTAISLAAAILIGDLIAQDTAATALIAAIAAAALALRLSLWRGWLTLDVPLLWVLHLGYAWLVIGVSLKAVWLLGGFGWAMNWMHALTAGAFGTMILAVTTRAALGHTGRPLAASRLTAVSYLLVTLAASLRVWGPSIAPALYWPLLSAAVIAWVAAFAIFLLVYAPILIQPRADGQPG